MVYCATEATGEITLHRKPVNAIDVQSAREFNAAYRLAQGDYPVRAQIAPAVYSVIPA